MVLIKRLTNVHLYVTVLNKYLSKVMY